MRSFPILLKILLVAAFCCQSALAFADGKIKLQPATSSKLQSVTPSKLQPVTPSKLQPVTSSKLQPVTSKLQTVDSLPDVVRQTLALHFGQSDQYKNFDELAQSFAVPNKFKKPAGLFVTLSRKGKTRACWGSMYPQYPNLVVGAVYTTESALSKEYRYKKIKEAEWQLLKPQVTVVRGVEPITSINDQNPLMYGLMVRTGNKSAVILPGEAIDAHYQLMMCKVKAGIASNQPCQIYRIKADVFK